MTPGQRKWLLTLAKDGPQCRPRFGTFPMAQCKRLGWTDSQWVDADTLAPLLVAEVIERKWQRVKLLEHITDVGRSAVGLEAMPEPTPGEPWAFVAMRGGKMLGVIAANCAPNLIRDFYCDFAGTDIKTVFSRDEYNSILKRDE